MTVEYADRMLSVHVESGAVPHAQTVTVRHHQIVADEGPALGGQDAGLNPGELLLAAVGTCVAITIRMYAARKGWDVERVAVDLTGRDDNGVYVIERRLTFTGALDDEQRARLTDIAGRCPVSKRVTGAVEIRAVA